MAFIEKLIQKGKAYDSNGSVYFDTNAFKKFYWSGGPAVMIL